MDNWTCEKFTCFANVRDVSRPAYAYDSLYTN